MGNKKDSKIILGCLFFALIVVFVIVVPTVLYDNHNFSKKSFMHAEYGDRPVYVDTLTRVMYDKELGVAIIDSNGTPILYEGKFPWE